MTWIYIGIVAGSLVTAGFDSQEKCEGRRAMLEKQKIAGKCVEAPPPYGTSSTLQFYGGTTIVPVN
jgi:hypothetical protein